MAKDDGKDWIRALKEAPGILRAEFWVSKHPLSYGTLCMFIEGRPPEKVELPPRLALILKILQGAYDEGRGILSPLDVRGRIDRHEMARRYKTLLKIEHGVPGDVMTNYMGIIQRQIRDKLGLPRGRAFPDLVFVRENPPGEENGARLREPGLLIHWKGE